ncbi:MAG: ATP-dependent helicase RecQ, partial [Thermoleophilaceae bacterium]|nr:ATP-dependent helicase RecQ [Thermoleophilaceae bacterium]
MDLNGALQQHFGFPAFRPGQREAVEAAVAGRDVLVVMPTGSGKSLCYQLPALLRDDLTIVVSPLVALMQDQVEALHARGLGDKVALVNAQQDAGANSAVLAAAAKGDLRLLYVAPERFSSPGFVQHISRARVGLFVVDEAHCVSQWGHDFRPDYFRLADAARHIGADGIVASTATATPQVAADIVRRLSLRDPVKVATGFDRPNISFAVARPAPHEKALMLVEALREQDALPAIIYAGTRAGSEDLASTLTKELGEEAAAYHAGLEREHRADVQRRFLANDIRVVVATNAFGMGVDKPNVRTVVHATVPSSLEAYYQEAGRGGRDGAPARALLLAENRDKALHVHFIKRDELDEKLPEKLARRLLAASDAGGELPGMSPARYALDARELADSVGCDTDQLRALIGHLSRAGLIEPTPSSPDRVAGRIVGEWDGRAEALCRQSVGDAGRARWRQYRDIWAYVEGSSCRRTEILRHFGDGATPEPTVACCDVCAGGLVPQLPEPDPGSVANLDDAILSVARSARPAVGRTTCAEILHGAKT